MLDKPSKSGLFGKYIVHKADGSPVSPEADYFVLRLDTDPAARAAVLEYANRVFFEAPRLARDLRERVLSYERGA
jgi:hypothetical protein